MSNPTIEEPTAFVRYARKLPTEQYGSAEASVSLPIPVPEEGVGDQAFLGKVNSALADAKVEVWTALGIEFEVVDGELVEKAKPVANAPTSVAAASNVVTAAFGGATPAAESCGLCGGDVWDNTTNKRNPRGPDYKCRDRSCGGAMWVTGRSAGEWKS